MTRIRPVSHRDRLGLVEHLDELRFRLVLCAAALAVAFGLCFWQNDLVLHLLNKPLPPGIKPTTLSPSEPFITTVTVSAYAALVLTLPVLIYQLYAFVIPAFSPEERRAVVPLMALIPLLLVGGIVFSYFVVLPNAVKFLLNFNDTQFAVQVRARDYYSFVALVCLVMGVVFQLPVGILALARLGIVNVEKLRKNRRVAYVVIAVVAAALPGTDPLTMILEMVPMLLLYELSILLVTLFAHPQVESPTSTEGSAP